MKTLVKIWSYIVKPFTHNLCDTCGFTKNNIYMTEVFTEGGLYQCQECINKGPKENNMTEINFKDVNNRKDFLSVDGETAISAHGEIFNIGDLVEHEDTEAGQANIISFELDKKSNDVRANTEKGWARICFITKIQKS